MKSLTLLFSTEDSVLFPIVIYYQSFPFSPAKMNVLLFSICFLLLLTSFSLLMVNHLPGFLFSSYSSLCDQGFLLCEALFRRLYLWRLLLPFLRPHRKCYAFPCTSHSSLSVLFLIIFFTFYFMFQLLKYLLIKFITLQKIYT